ncbi:TPA: hypothetical protein MD441_002419 [Escherichia coli]|nr:hypothetical protein [Escherichia coli]
MIENPPGSFVEKIFTDLRNEIILRCDLLGHINVTTKDNIKRFKHTLENVQTLDANNTSPITCGTTLANYTCSNPYTGSTFGIGYTRTDLSEKIKLCEVLKNKQYQWVITEAYELFEDYIKKIYAHTVSIHDHFWSPSEFKNVQIEQNGDMEAYYNAIKRNNKAPKKILKVFRRKLPNFRDVEINNKIGKNYRFEITLIELLRHTIVHNAGKFTDTEKFITKVLDESSISGKTRNNLEIEIRQYIAKEKDSDIIMLLEAPSEKLGYMGWHFKKAEYLLGEILEYSLIIKNELIAYLDNH